MLQQQLDRDPSAVNVMVTASSLLAIGAAFVGGRGSARNNSKLQLTAFLIRCA